MIPLILFGASGHARVVADAARASGSFELLGIVDKRVPPGEKVDGIEVLGSDDLLPRLVEARPDLRGIVGIGDNRLREAVVRVALQRCPGFQFAPVVHPKTTIAADVTIGAGTFVAAGVVINCGSKIGAHVVVNTSASIDHDCHIDDFAFVAPGVALAGSVQLMKRSFVGIGSCVIQGTTIGADAIVGAGAAVIDDVAPDTTVVGVPARVKSRRA